MMIDPTFDGFFIDEKRIPLSVLEIREHLVNDEFATFVNTTSKMKNLYILRNKNMYKNSYFAKNLFFIFVDQYNGFGVGKDYLFLIPEGFSIKERSIKNWEYRLANLNKENEHLRDRFKQRLEEAKNMSEPTAYSTSTVTNIKK